MNRVRIVVMVAALAWLAGSPANAVAQTLGTFQWRLQPFCNVIAVSVTQTGGVFRLDGHDDQCGGQRASAIGVATPRHDGDISLGLSLVLAPGAVPLHLNATLSLASLGGTWRDSAGNNGTLTFVAGPAAGGSPRPPSTGLGAVSVDTSVVQRRISGTCAAETVLRAVNEDGSVVCGGGGGNGDVTTLSGRDGVNLSFSGTRYTVSFSTTGLTNPHGLVAGSPLSPTLRPAPVEGPGRRLMWHASKGAFRVGEVDQQWNSDRIGAFSVAFGQMTQASGEGSAASGFFSAAEGRGAVALGALGTATGEASFAMGVGAGPLTARALAEGFASVAIGLASRASGRASIALGANADVPPGVEGSFVFGSSSAIKLVGGANQFNVGAPGSARFITGANGVGVTLGANEGAWASTSDARLKTGFRTLSGDAVLATLAGVPIQEWSYKAQGNGVRHIGPTAQDFYRAFALGPSELSIDTVDADGIALLALQALERRTAEMQRRTKALQHDAARIEKRVDKLQRSRADVEVRKR